MIYNQTKASKIVFRLLLTTVFLLFLAIFFIVFSSSSYAQTVTSHDPVIIKNTEALPSAELSLKINDIVVPYSVFSVFVLPKETVEFEILYSQSEQGYELRDNTRGTSIKSKNRWKWKAGSTPGHSQLTIKSLDNNASIVINAFVMVPASQLHNGKLNDYHIGHYPDESDIKNTALYVVPDGFIKVTKDNQNLKLSPHFSLKEFISKQKSTYPKYVYLQSKLLLKLEKIRQELILQNIPVTNMVVMSGYRTPYYNKAIGNVKFSRHVFGDAADIFIDNDGDYKMDDINQDGRFNIKDAELMASIIESLARRESYKGLVGGLGIYGSKPHRGAFIHVDTRGVKARWRQ